MILNIFRTDLRKILKYNVIKIHQWKPSCSTRTDGQMDKQTWCRASASLFATFWRHPKRLSKPLHCGQGGSIGSRRTCLLHGTVLPVSPHTLIAAASLSCPAQRHFTDIALTLIISLPSAGVGCSSGHYRTAASASDLLMLSVCLSRRWNCAGY